MPMISVIVPVYNSRFTIETCIKSVLNQKYEDFELLIINDGSDDGTDQLLERIIDTKNRMRIIHTQNMGVSKARNRGIDESVGKYLTFIDSDDFIADDYLYDLINEIEYYGAELVICGYQKTHITPYSTEFIECPSFVGNTEKFIDVLSEYLNNSIIQGPCWKIFVREKIINNKIYFPIDINYGEDTIFVLNYLLVIDSICALNKSAYYYVLSDGNSLSKRYSENRIYTVIEHIKLIEQLYAKYIKEVDKVLISRMLFNAYTKQIEDLVNQKNMALKVKIEHIKRLSELPIFNGFFKKISSISKYRHRFLIFMCLNRLYTLVYFYYYLKFMFHRILSSNK